MLLVLDPGKKSYPERGRKGEPRPPIAPSSASVLETEL